MNGIRINMDSNGWHCSVDDSQGAAWDDASLLPPDIVPEYLPDIFDQLLSDENDGYIIWNTTPSEPLTPGPHSASAQTPNYVPVTTTSSASSSSAGMSHPVGSGNSNHDKGSSSNPKRWSVGDQFKSKDFSTAAAAAASTESANRTSGEGQGLSVQIPGSASLRSSENAPPPPTPPPSFSHHKTGFRDTNGALSGGGSSGSTPESTEGRILMAAMVEKLVEKLTSVIDYTFLTDFFLIYRLFIAPVALLKLLILRFHWALLDDTPERQIVRIRTFVTLRHWLLNYFGHDFMTSKELRSTLTTYLNSLPDHPRIAASPRDQRIVKELKKYTQSLKKIHYRNIAQQRLERKSRRALLRQSAAAAATTGQSRSKLSRAERARLTQSMSTTDDLMPTSSHWGVDHQQGSSARRRRSSSKAMKRKMSVQMATSAVLLQSPTHDGAEGGGEFPRSATQSARSSSGINDAASLDRHSRTSEPVTEELSVDFRSSEQEDDDDDDDDEEEEEEEEEGDDSELDDITDDDDDDEIECSSEQSLFMSDSMDSMEESNREERLDRDQRQEESLDEEDGIEYDDEGGNSNHPSTTQLRYQHQHDQGMASTSVDHHGGYYPSSPGATRRLESNGGHDSFSSRSVSYRGTRPGIPNFDGHGQQQQQQQQQQRASNRVSTAWSRTMRIHGHESTASLRDRRAGSMAFTQDLIVPASSLTPGGSSNGGYHHHQHHHHHPGGSSGHLYLLPSAGSQASTMESLRSVEPYMNPPPRAHVHREKKKTWARYMSATVGRLSKMKRALTSGSLSSTNHKNDGGGFGTTSNSSTSSRYRNGGGHDGHGGGGGGGGGGGSLKDSITEPATSSASQARLFKHLQSQYSDHDNDKVTRTHYFLGSCSAIQFGSSSSSSPNQLVRSSATAATGHSRQHGGGGGGGGDGIGSGRQRIHDGSLWSSDEDYSQYEMTHHSHSLRSASSSHRHHPHHGYGSRDMSGYDESSIDREGSSLHSHHSRAWQQQQQQQAITPGLDVSDKYRGDGCSPYEQPQNYPYQSPYYHQDDELETSLAQSVSAPVIVRSDGEVDYQMHGQQQQHQESHGGSEAEEDGDEDEHEDPFRDNCQRRHSLDDPYHPSVELTESGDLVEDVLQPPPPLLLSSRTGLSSHRLRRTTRGRPRDNRRASWRTLSSTNSSMFGALLSEDHRPPGQTVLERMQDPTVGNIDKFVEKLNLGQGFFSPPDSNGNSGIGHPTSTTPATSKQASQFSSRGYHPFQQGPPFNAKSRQPLEEEEEEEEQEPVVQKQPTRRRSSWILDNILMHSLSSKDSTETITNAKVASSAKRNSTPSKLTTATMATTAAAPKSPGNSQTMSRAQKRQTMPLPLLYQHRHRKAFMDVGGSESIDGSTPSLAVDETSSPSSTSRRHSSDTPGSERWRLFPMLGSGWYSQQQQQQQRPSSPSATASSTGLVNKMVPDTAALRPVAPAHAPLTSLQALPEHLTLRQVLSMHPDDLKQESTLVSTTSRQASQPSQATLRSKPLSPSTPTHHHPMPDEQVAQGPPGQYRPPLNNNNNVNNTPSSSTPLKRPTAGQKRSTSQPHLLTQSQLTAQAAANGNGSTPGAAAVAAPPPGVRVPSRHSHHPSMPIQGSSGSWYHQSSPHPHQQGAIPTSVALRREHHLPPHSAPIPTSTPTTIAIPTTTTPTTEHYRHQKYSYQRYDPRVTPVPAGYQHPSQGYPFPLQTPSLPSSPAAVIIPSPLPAGTATTTTTPRAPSSFVLRYRTELIAQQLCLIERELLNNVQWYELVDAGWTRKSSPPPPPPPAPRSAPPPPPLTTASSSSATTTPTPAAGAPRASSALGTFAAAATAASASASASASGLVSSSSSCKSSTRKQKQKQHQQQQQPRRQRVANTMPARSLSSATTATTASSSSNVMPASGGHGNGPVEEDAQAATAKRYSRTRKRSASEGGLVVSGSRGTGTGASAGAGGPSGQGNNSGSGNGGRRMSSTTTPIETTTTTTTTTMMTPTTTATVGMTLSIAPIRSRRHPKNASEESQGIKALIDRFNLTCQWVTTEILSTRDLSERARVVEKFIRIAQTCYNHSNFSSLIQLILGLQSHNVSRLTKTWARVRPKEILMMQDLIEFTSPFNNWKHLRDAMKNIADEWGGSGATPPTPTPASGGAGGGRSTSSVGGGGGGVGPSDDGPASSSHGQDGRRTKSHRGFFGMKTGGGGSGHEANKASPMVDPLATAPASQDKGGEERRVKQGGCIPFLGLYLSDLVYNTELPSYVEPRGPPVQLAMRKPLPAVPRRPSSSVAVTIGGTGCGDQTSSSDVVLVGGGGGSGGITNTTTTVNTAANLPTPLNSPLSKSPPNTAPIQTWAGAAVTASVAVAASVATAAAATTEGDEAMTTMGEYAKAAKTTTSPSTSTSTSTSTTPPPPPPPRPPKLINFHKHRTTATIIKRVLTFRTIAARYPFRQEPEVYAQLLAIRGMDATEMEHASYLCEERVSDAGRTV
ncbi:hypothetical protein DFQ27_001730 [Actinomortierella ambigua]|uniref:N-terminal Ras-GEF domain-containing protein n=1 Tax=Actinomortierella ambigua TaxID=1343610 RepID=A0A9P6QLS1_9FUNG|nr:hypothetical protein DFQ27_001730 [Actinomortierella ambigua]